MTAVEHGSPYEAADMCLGSQLDTAPIPDTPLLASVTDDEHDERIPVYIEVTAPRDTKTTAADEAASNLTCLQSP